VIAPAREAQRKALHLTTIVVPLALADGRIAQRWIVLGLATLVLVAVTVEVARRRSAGFRARFARTVGAMLREHERADGARAGITGATWLLCALAGAAALPVAAAIAATWAAGVGDAMAALVGRAWRRVRPGEGKTLAGSLACAIATAAGAAALAGFTVPQALLIGTAAAAAERPAWRMDDNLRVATGAAVVALALLALR
jgi:dolichol kinase